MFKSQNFMWTKFLWLLWGSQWLILSCIISATQSSSALFGAKLWPLWQQEQSLPPNCFVCNRYTGQALRLRKRYHIITRKLSLYIMEIYILKTPKHHIPNVLVITPSLLLSFPAPLRLLQNYCYFWCPHNQDYPSRHTNLTALSVGKGKCPLVTQTILL